MEEIHLTEIPQLPIPNILVHPHPPSVYNLSQIPDKNPSKKIFQLADNDPTMVVFELDGTCEYQQNDEYEYEAYLYIQIEDMQQLMELFWILKMTEILFPTFCLSVCKNLPPCFNLLIVDY